MLLPPSQQDDKYWWIVTKSPQSTGRNLLSLKMYLWAWNSFWRHSVEKYEYLGYGLNWRIFHKRCTVGVKQKRENALYSTNADKRSCIFFCVIDLWSPLPGRRYFLFVLTDLALKTYRPVISWKFILQSKTVHVRKVNPRLPFERRIVTALFEGKQGNTKAPCWGPS